MYVVRDFKFQGSETLPELKLAYRTLGTPQRDASGNITNALLFIHGTTGTGENWLAHQNFTQGALWDAHVAELLEQLP